MDTNLSPMGSPEGNSQTTMSVIDSLKRLERLGSENSKAMEKLIQAAREIADQIVKHFAVRDSEYVYLLVDLHGQQMRYAIEKSTLVFPEGYGGSVARDRENALRFAKDIANGLLEGFAEILAKRLEDTASGADIFAKRLEDTASGLAAIDQRLSETDQRIRDSPLHKLGFPRLPPLNPDSKG
jgi:hypothetical protein